MSSNIKYLDPHRVPRIPIPTQVQDDQPDPKPSRAWRGTGAAVFRPGHIAAGFSSKGVVALVTPELHQEMVLQVLEAAVPLNRPALQATILKFDLALRQEGPAVLVDRAALELMAILARHISDLRDALEGEAA